MLINEPSYSEKELLEQLAAGSEEAFRVLFTTYQNKLYTYIFKLSGSVETAEDTVHDIFLKIWQQREQVTAIENLNAYLYRMAHNQAFTLFKRRAKETLVLAEIQQEQGIETGFEGEDRIVQQEVSELIHECVSQLTPQQKKIFLMSRHNGFKLSEIAQRLGISEQTVKNHLTIALKFIREEIGRSYGSQAVIIYVLYHLPGL